MKETQKVTKKYNETKCYCDFCFLDNIKKEVEYDPKCYICDINICREHTVFDPDDYGDYPTKYCTNCWKIGEPYRIRMKDLEDRADEEIEKESKLWQKAAKEKLQQLYKKNNC
jgi:hypothetical protein